MADSSHYLRIVLDGVGYLLPSTASVTIEPREAMVSHDGPGPVAAWRRMRQGSAWPAYGVDAGFAPSRPAHWQRAVFLEGGRQPLGLVADEVHMLSGTDMHVAPFVPLGPAPTPFGHLINGAWVEGEKVTLVLDPPGLIGFLRSFGGAG